MNHYALDCKGRWVGDVDIIPVYSWANTPEEACEKVETECLLNGMFAICTLNKELTKKLQDEHDRIKKLPWWKRPFATFKYP